MTYDPQANWTEKCGTATYSEVWPGSPEREFYQDGTAARRTLLTHWDSTEELSRNLLGWPELVKVASGSWYLSRKTPQPFPGDLAHPTRVGGATTNPFGDPRDYRYAVKVSRAEGVGAKVDYAGDDAYKHHIHKMARYALAKVEVQYETLTYEVREDSQITASLLGSNHVPDESYLERYVTVLAAPQSQYLTLPQGTLVWAQFGGAVPGTPGKLIPSYDLSITWHQVPLPAVGMRGFNPYLYGDADGPIDLCLGRVNIADWYWPAAVGGGVRFRKGTLLLVAAAIKPIRSAIGNRLYDIEYRFKLLPVTSRVAYDGDLGPEYLYGHNLLYTVIPPAGCTLPGYYEPASGGSLTYGTDAAAGPTITYTNQNTLAVVTSSANLVVGATVSSEAVRAGTTIIGLSGVFVTLSTAATKTGSYTTVFGLPSASNLAKIVPLAGRNIYDYADMSALFKVPTLSV